MKRNYHTNLAFLDLLFNTLLCFAALQAASVAQRGRGVAVGEGAALAVLPRQAHGYALQQ